jgi:methyl-accepting chemotaxis protein
MVEQSTAASLSLSREASDLAELVGRFQVTGGGAARAPAAIRQAHARIEAFAANPQPQRPRLAALGGRTGDWQEF